MDTEDLVQEAVVSAFRRAGVFEELDAENLRRYLIVAIQNRIRDEVRRSRLGEVVNGNASHEVDVRPSPFDESVESEERRRYREALVHLDKDDQELLVGRIELQLTYDELALVTRRPTADAARCAARRAALRLAKQMGSE